MRFTHHLVRHYQQVKFFCDGSNLFQFFLRENLADRVVWSIDDYHFSPRGDSTAMNWLVRGKEGSRFGIPQFIKVYPPVAAGWPFAGQIRMQGNINGFPAVEGDGRKELIEERFEHDDLVALLQEGGEYRVLTW